MRAERGLHAVFDETVAGNCCYRQIDGLAPTFSKKPAIRQEDDGKRLLFECRIQADPTPSVVWSHGGNAVKDDARHKVSFSIRTNKQLEDNIAEIFAHLLKISDFCYSDVHRDGIKCGGIVKLLKFNFILRYFFCIVNLNGYKCKNIEWK